MIAIENFPVPEPFLHPMSELSEVKVEGQDKPDLVMNLWAAASMFVWSASTQFGNLDAINDFLAIASESRAVNMEGAKALLARCRARDEGAIRAAIAIIEGSLNEKIQEAMENERQS